MSKKNVELVRSMYNALNRGDMAFIIAQFAPDAVVFEVESMPYAGEYHGIDGVQQLFMNMGATWEQLSATIEQTFDEDDDVLVLATLSGKLRGVDQPLAMKIAEHWRLHDGKVTMIRPFYIDTALIARLWAERETVAV